MDQVSLCRKNVGLNVGTYESNVGYDVGLTKTEKAVLKLLVQDGRETAESISTKIDVSKRTVERALSSLQDKKYIERVGSRRDGYWLVIR